MNVPSTPSEPGMVEWVNRCAPDDIRMYFVELSRRFQEDGSLWTDFRQTFDTYWFQGRLSSADPTLKNLVGLAPGYGSHNSHIDWTLIARGILEGAGR